MQKSSETNINIKTFKKLCNENKDKIAEIKRIVPDLDNVLEKKRQLSFSELNRVAKVLKINMVSLYLAPEVYEKAYEYYKVIHQCKELEEKVGFMNKFGIHFTKLYDNFLLEKARFCPYCGYELEE